MNTRQFVTALKSIFLALTFLTPFSAYSQVAPIAAGVVVENLAHDIASSLNATIKQLESSATVTTFNTRSDLLVVLDNVKNVSDGLVGKTFGELNNSQKDFFERVSRFTTETANGVEVTTDRVDNLVNDLGDALSRLPGSDKSPFVSRFSPSYFLESTLYKYINITGTLLGTGTPTLSFNEKNCTAKVKTERTLKFECPPDIFSEQGKLVTGLLLVEDERPWYLGFLNNKNKHYTISVANIPDKFAEYSLETYTTESEVRTIDRSQDNSHMNEHCQGATPVSWTYTPTSGCDIDLTSVIAPAGISSQSTYNGIQSLTKTGFMVTGIARNNGTCAPRIFGHRAYVDGRGTVGVNARWKDICTTTSEKLQPIQVGSLQWSSQLSLQLPNNLSKFILKIKQSNGETHVITGNESHNWFTADFDRVTKVLVVKPKAIDLALK